MSTTAISGYSTSDADAQLWIDYNQTGDTINASYNVASVLDSAAGLFYVYPLRTLSTAAYSSVVGMRGTSASNDLTGGIVSIGTTQWGQRSRTASTFTDSPNFYVLIHGGG